MPNATVAYSTATGARFWVSRYGGPGSHAAAPTAVALRPSGDRVFVTGTAPGRSGGGLLLPFEKLERAQATLLGFGADVVACQSDSECYSQTLRSSVPSHSAAR